MSWQSFFQYSKQWYMQKKQNRRIKKSDITAFLRQFATLLVAGIPIIKICGILEKSQEKIALRLLITRVKRELQSGRQLAYCMRQHPMHFNEQICQLIHLGEQTGTLGNLFVLIADSEEKKLALKQRIKQILFYPSIILITAVVLMLSMLLFVIPRFAELFADTQDSLPWLTLWIFSLSVKLRKFGWLILFFIPIMTICIHYFKKNLLKNFWQPLFIKFPLLRGFFQKILLAHFIRNLSIACTAGLPILQGLQLARPTRTNRAFDHDIYLLKNRINAGESMHQAMSSDSFFPAFIVQMIKVGEESGMLDAMLAKTADFLEADIEQLTLRLGQTLEPLIMIVLGALIGGLVISMYLPIFKLGSTL